MSKKGIIQNADLLDKVCLNGREFIIQCEDEKDANSKRVSLYNAKRELTENQQKCLKIKKVKINDVWSIRIYKEKEQKVLEVIDGNVAKMKVDELSKEGLELIYALTKDKCSKEEIKEALIDSGEDTEAVENEISKW